MKISVIVPIYFYNEFVEGMLWSIKDQSYKSIELIIVGNNLSVMEFEEIKQKIDLEFLSSETSLKYIHTEISGANNARRLGYLESTGSYVFFLDSDDQLARSGLIANVVRVLNEEDIDILSVNLQHAELVDGECVPKNVIYNYIKPNQVLRIENDYKVIVKNYGTNICARFIKKDLLKDITFLEVPFAQDWNISSKLFGSAKNFYFMSQPSYYWVFRKNSISKMNSMTYKMHVDAFNSILDIVEYYRAFNLTKPLLYFLNDRIIRFSFQYSARARKFDLDGTIDKCRELMKKEVKFNFDVLSNKRIMILYLMIKFRRLMKFYLKRVSSD